MSWNLGYVTEIDYTHGYYRTLAPNILELAVLARQHAASVRRPLRYLELGYGQGLSLNIHAASVEGEFWGTDFNPSQATNARELAAASGANVRTLDDSFAELAARTDLPEFDIIGLHGIWSWISRENQLHIVDIVRRRLAVGGILYVSYNCLPGWAAAMPLRHLMTLHADLAAPEAQGMSGRIQSAIDSTQAVIDSGALYFRANPSAKERLKKIRDQNRNYLAHEYFNADWDSMYFSQIAAMLDEAKVSFVASAHLCDHVDAINLSADMQKLMKGITHPVLRESVRDYCVNQQFRRDVFVKGPRKLTMLQQVEALKARRFMLTARPEDINLKVTGALGEATLQEPVYRPFLDAMGENNLAPKSIAQLLAHPKTKGLGLPQIAQCTLLLTGNGDLSPVQEDASIERMSRHSNALNKHLIAQAAHSGETSFLASPVIGGGIVVPRLQQIFLAALAQGRKTPEEWGRHAWGILGAQGQRVVKDGKPIESAEENIAHLTGQAKEFGEKRLPVLKALRIA